MDVLLNTTGGDWSAVSNNHEMESTGLQGQEKGPFFLLEAGIKMHTLIQDVSIRTNNKTALFNLKKSFAYCPWLLQILHPQPFFSLGRLLGEVWVLEQVFFTLP